MTFLAFAVPTSLLGVMWPDVRDRFGQTVGTLGLVTLVYGLARSSAALSGRPLMRRFGTGPSFVGVLVGLVVVCGALGGAPSWPMFLAAVAGVGLVSGMLDSLGAVFITHVGDIGTAGVIQGSYGVGATVGPLLVAVTPGWRPAALASAAIALVALVAAAQARQMWPSIEDQLHDAPGTRSPLPKGPAIVSLALFATFVAVEVTTGLWTHTYLTDHRGVDGRVAAVGVAGFWAGITVGRLAMSRAGVARVIRRRGLAQFAGAAGLMVVALAVLPAVAAAAGLALVGLALAPVVPSLFATTVTRMGMQHASRMAMWQLLATNFGAICVPSLTGALVDSVGAGVVVIVIAASLLAVGMPLLAVVDRLAIG